MSKKIKFRAWDKIKNEMCDVMGIDFIRNMVLCFPITKRTIRAGKWRPLDEFELLEFTGFCDKSNKEIYKGDILYHPVQGKRKVYYPFSDRLAAFGLEELSNGMKSDLDNPFLYEIIGNIYEGESKCEP